MNILFRSQKSTTLLDDICTMLQARITKVPTLPTKQVKRDWKFSQYSKHIKVLGEKRNSKDFNVLAEISTSKYQAVIIKPTKNISITDLKMLKEIISHWTPALSVSIEGLEWKN